MPRPGSPRPRAPRLRRTRFGSVAVLAIAALALTGCVSFPVIQVPAPAAKDGGAAVDEAEREAPDSSAATPDPAPGLKPAESPKPAAPAPAQAPAPAPPPPPGRVGAPTMAADALRTSDGVVRFLTPSGNIYCEIAPALGASSVAGLPSPPSLAFQGQAGVSCELGAYPDPSPADLAAVDCGSLGLHGGNIAITAGAQQYGACRGGATFMYLVVTGQQAPPTVGTFEYGSSISEAGFRCHSAFEGLTCESEATGRGFFASRERTEFFGG